MPRVLYLIVELILRCKKRNTLSSPVSHHEVANLGLVVWFEVLAKASNDNLPKSFIAQRTKRFEIRKTLTCSNCLRAFMKAFARLSLSS